MKKFICTLLAIMSVFGLCACGQTNEAGVTMATKEPTKEMLEVAIVSMNVALYGLPEGCPKTPEGYTIIRDYRVTDPSYVPETVEEAAEETAENE